MKFRTVYQFRWVLVIFFIAFIYVSGLVLIELPFLRINFPSKDLNMGLIPFLLSFFPRLSFEMQIYNIQTVVAWTIGIILGSRLGAITLGIYLLLGLVGLPIFAGGGGFDYFKEPTFGYLISFPVNAYLSGFFYSKNKKILAVILPIFSTHILGILYLLLFKLDFLDITWHLSFSMIGYDLIFTLLLTPVIPILRIILNEMVIQEIAVRESFVKKEEERFKKRYKSI